MLYVKPSVNVRTARSEHFEPFNTVHQTFSGRSARLNFRKSKKTRRRFVGIRTAAMSDSDTLSPHKSEVEPAHLDFFV